MILSRELEEHDETLSDICLIVDTVVLCACDNEIRSDCVCCAPEG